MIRRKDDEPETVRHRLDVYEKKTRSLIHYYQGRRLLKAVDGQGSIEDIFECIVNQLDLSTKKT